MDEELTSLEQLLDKMGEAEDDGDQVSLGSIMEAVGSRSFGPLLLLAGVIALSPLSGIPGVPTLMGVLVLLIAVQMLFGRDHFWMPNRLLKRSLKKDRLDKALNWMRRPARAIDRWSKPRLSVLIQGPGMYIVAIICILIGIGMPLMELLPFSATAAGAALTAFGLSLISRDGLLAVLALAATAVIFGLIIHNFF